MGKLSIGMQSSIAFIGLPIQSMPLQFLPIYWISLTDTVVTGYLPAGYEGQYVSTCAMFLIVWNYYIFDWATLG